MPANIENSHHHTKLQEWVSSFETEMNYQPLVIELDATWTATDIPALEKFLKEPRKRLFIFKFQNPDDQPELDAHNQKLAFFAQRSFLSHHAQELEKSAAKPSVNPLKFELNSPRPNIRTPIQIQHHYQLSTGQRSPSPQIQASDTPSTGNETPRDTVLLNQDQFSSIPNLFDQLNDLGILNIERKALELIQDHAHAFTDGLIPNNLPVGLYINWESKALCFNEHPQKLPSALAPKLEPVQLSTLPSHDEVIQWDASLNQPFLKKLFASDVAEQTAGLIELSPSFADTLETLNPNQIALIVPLMAKMFIVGGEAHARLFLQLSSRFERKGFNINFLRDPHAQEDLLFSPQGLKNLHKLSKLSTEQKNWWNTLVTAHLENKAHRFEFNAFFEAFSLTFLPKLKEKNLVLPERCPIQHQGHFLVTLNRIFDVLTQSAHPLEQMAHLNDLNWGPTGVHYAVMNAPQPFKFVSSCMQLQSVSDASLARIPISESIQPFPFAFRYLGQHWPKNLNLSQIQDLLKIIDDLADFTPEEKSSLIMILVTSLGAEVQTTASKLAETLQLCVTRLRSFSSNERQQLLLQLVQCSQFKFHPDLIQILHLINEAWEIKTNFPEKSFITDSIQPLFTSFQHESFTNYHRIEEAVYKFSNESPQKIAQATKIAFAKVMNEHRGSIQLLVGEAYSSFISLLNTLTVNDLDTQIPLLLQKMESFKQAKPKLFQILLKGLGEFNLSKSQTAPQVKELIALFEYTLSAHEELDEFNFTHPATKTKMIQFITESSRMSGCVFGQGDLSDLDNLIVEGLVSAASKRNSLLNKPKLDILQKKLSDALDKYLIWPEGLRILKAQLKNSLLPLIARLADLTELLKDKNTSFEKIIESLEYFEKTKSQLVHTIFNLSIFGEAHGTHLLSFVITGKRARADYEPCPEEDSFLVSKIRDKVNVPFNKALHDFFAKEKNKKTLKDLNAEMVLKWLAQFNETHSLAFFFEDELVQKKVKPALEQVLSQLDTKDAAFEARIREVAQLPKIHESDKLLVEYRKNICGVSGYLQLLLELKTTAPALFHEVYQKINHPTFSTKVTYEQKTQLLRTLLKKPIKLMEHLELIQSALEKDNYPVEAVQRAINGIEDLFKIDGLDDATHHEFFEMILASNLRNPQPLPIKELVDLKRLPLSEEKKETLMKVVIGVFKHMVNGNTDHMREMIKQLTSFLTKQPNQTDLCLHLLEKLSEGHLSQNIQKLTAILNKLNELNPDVLSHVSAILDALACNRKDQTVKWPILYEITVGLSNDAVLPYLEEIKKLFNMSPPPTAGAFNKALIKPDKATLKVYCREYDFNPYGVTRFDSHTNTSVDHFAMDRVKHALSNLEDLLQGRVISHELQLQLARQLTYLEIFGFTDPLNPEDKTGRKKLTAFSREELQNQATQLLIEFRQKQVPSTQLEIKKLELLAYLREIYFRTTGLFPNTTQMLAFLISEHPDLTERNLLLQVKTGEGKSLITPILAVLQWTKGGTVDLCTANKTLLHRDFENTCKPFFNFFQTKTESGTTALIPCELIEAHTNSNAYQLNGINCSTLEDLSLFLLASRESKATRYQTRASYITKGNPIHMVVDECDDALLDQTTLYKLVSSSHQTSAFTWVYEIAYHFVRRDEFKNTAQQAWDEEEDIEQFIAFLKNEVMSKYNGDAHKLNLINTWSHTQLREWISSSLKAALLIENKHFVLSPTNEAERGSKWSCTPLVHSAPKPGCIFTDGVQQAIQTRLAIENPDKQFIVENTPRVLACQSARHLLQSYQQTGGRLVGISGTPGDSDELKMLSTQFGTQAFALPSHKGDRREILPARFTSSYEETVERIEQAINQVKKPLTKPSRDLSPEDAETFEEIMQNNEDDVQARQAWNKTQTQPVLIVAEDFDEAKKIAQSLVAYKEAGFKIQCVTGQETHFELANIIKKAGNANTITIGTAMLARGIDIDPKGHPEGLFAIQTYVDSPRLTTQIQGRAARNGHQGKSLTIYQVPPPQNLLAKLWHWLTKWFLPFLRRKADQKKVATLQAKIKQQTLIERNYIQAIDHIQQTLIQQVHAWESLLTELYHDNDALKAELYNWRTELLSELNKFQATTLSKDNPKERDDAFIQRKVEEFKNAVSRYWENSKEKWMEKAEKAHRLGLQQTQYRYLKTLSLEKELQVQLPQHKQTAALQNATQTLSEQNIELTILNKAAVELYYHPQNDKKDELELARHKQLLPELVAQLCHIYPGAVPFLQKLHPKKDKGLFLIDFIKNALIKDQVRKQLTEEFVELYKEKVQKANHAKTIRELILPLKPLMLELYESLKKERLEVRFQAQGLFLTFMKLYEESGLHEIEDALSRGVILHDSEKQAELEASRPQFSREQYLAFLNLKACNQHDIMKQLAQYLMNQFSWVNIKPLPLHAKLENEIAINAAQELYQRAILLESEPHNKEHLENLYQSLLKHHLKLRHKLWISVGHTTPKNVINTAISAIGALVYIPNQACEKTFRENVYNQALIDHHKDKFKICLNQVTERIPSSHQVLWNQMTSKLDSVCRSTTNEDVFNELFDTLTRFVLDPQSKEVFEKALNELKNRLTKSIETLKKPDGLRNKDEVPSFEQKQTQFEALFQAPQLRTCFDGFNTYIELQIESDKEQQGFTGYCSSSLLVLEEEKTSMQSKLSKIRQHDIDLTEQENIDLFSITPALAEELAMLVEIKKLKLGQTANLEKRASHIQRQQQFVNELIDLKKSLDQNSVLSFRLEPIDDEVKGLIGLLEAYTALHDPKYASRKNEEKLTQMKSELDTLVLSQHPESDHEKKQEELKRQIDGLSLFITLKEIEKKKQALTQTEPNSKERKQIETSLLELKEKRSKLLPFFYQDAYKEEVQKTYDLTQSIQNEKIELKAKIKSKIDEIVSHSHGELERIFSERRCHLISTLEQTLQNNVSAIDQLILQEKQKARFKTRRFFDTRELFQYQETLTRQQPLQNLEQETSGVNLPIANPT